MDVAEFEDLLDRLGEDLSRWPREQERLARSLLESSVEARELLREAEAMRGLLSGPPLRAPPGLADRIVADAVRDAAPERVSPGNRYWEWLSVALLGGRPLVRTAFLALCFAGGVFASVVHHKNLLDSDEVDFHEFIGYSSEVTVSTK